MPVSDQITSFEAIPATYPRHINNTKPRLLPLACPVLNIFQIEQYQLTEKAVSIKVFSHSVPMLCHRCFKTSVEKTYCFLGNANSSALSQSVLMNCCTIIYFSECQPTVGSGP